MTLGKNLDAAYTSELAIAVDHPAFAGHFPGFPVLPGAALLDEALQRISVAHRLDLSRWQIAAVKFLEPVRPGDRLTLEVAAPPAEFAAPLAEKRATRDVLKFTIRRANVVVVSGTLSPTDPHETAHGH